MHLNTKIKNSPAFSAIVFQIAGFLAVTVIECLKEFTVTISLLVKIAKNQRTNLIRKASR